MERMIIGTILSIVAVQAGTSAAAGDGWAVSYNQLMRADNLLKLTLGVGQGIAAELQANAMKYMEETEAMIAEYEKESARITELYKKNIGEGNGIDPLLIAELASKFEYSYEKPDSFLTRTLMTGDDIAELSQDMIENFVNITTSVEPQ